MAGGFFRPEPKEGNEAVMSGKHRIRLLAMARSGEIKHSMLAFLADHPDLEVETHESDLGSVNGNMAARLDQADILLLDVDPAAPTEIAQLRRLIESRKGRGAVIATSADMTLDVARNLFRLGVDDCLDQPLVREKLADALANARRRLHRREDRGSHGAVIAVTRAKGGMGATTLAAHLAIALAEPKSRKEKPKRVVAIDLDLQFGDLALHLDLPQTSGMVEVMQDPSRLDSALLAGSLAQHGSGLSILPSPADPVPLDALKSETAGQLIDLARRDFDYVVVDLPLALASWQDTVLGRADKLFLVTQMNVPAIRQTRRLIEILKDEGLFNLPLGVVLNRYVWRLSERAQLRQSEKALDHAFDHYLPNDHKNSLEAINRGLSLFEVRKRAPLCRAIRELAAACETELKAKRRGDDVQDLAA
jgi:pilus assembly protein CpaE